jgi:hypothetical protein
MTPPTSRPSFEPLPEIDATELAARGGMAHYFEPRSPVIVRGLAAGWDFMHRWTPSYLGDCFGDFQCTIVHDSRPDLARETCSLATHFRERPHLDTMTIVPLDKRDEWRFFRDIPLPNPCFRREQLSAFFFFHTHLGRGSLPHCHEDAFNLLQRGEKRWVIYDADPVVSPRGWELLRDCLAEFGEGSQVSDWFERGLEPLARAGIRVYEGVQAAGDVVFVPVRFAHAAMNLSETLGLAAVVSRPGSPYIRGADGRYVLPGRPPEAEGR